jgi:cytochrome c
MSNIHLAAITTLLLIALSDRATAQPGDPARGERIYRACVACHSLEPNRNMTCPSLAEIWDQKSGSKWMR